MTWRFLLTWLGCYQWYYRLQARRAARMAATRHLALVAKALFTGSTEAYTLMQDLPRVEGSSEVEWWRD